MMLRKFKLGKLSVRPKAAPDADGEAKISTYLRKEMLENTNVKNIYDEL